MSQVHFGRVRFDRVRFDSFGCLYHESTWRLDMDGWSAQLWWWIGGGVLMAAELIVPGVYLLWLGLGAMLTGVMLWWLPDLSPILQGLVFAASMFVSLAMGFFVQRFGGRRLESGPLNREIEALTGQVYVASSDFVAGRGRIRVGDTTYAAEATEQVQRGDRIRVKGHEGLRLKVEPLVDASINESARTK